MVAVEARKFGEAVAGFGAEEFAAVVGAAVVVAIEKQEGRAGGRQPHALELAVIVEVEVDAGVGQRGPWRGAIDHQRIDQRAADGAGDFFAAFEFVANIELPRAAVGKANFAAGGKLAALGFSDLLRLRDLPARSRGADQRPCLVARRRALARCGQRPGV